MNQNLKEALGEVWHAIARAGAKKISNWSGRNAGEVDAAKAVAEEFIACLKKSALGFAKAQCAKHLKERLEQDHLRAFFEDIDFKGAAWKCEEPEAEYDLTGAVSQITFPGLLAGAKLGGQPGSVEVPFKITLVKEEDKWRVGGLSR